MKTARKSIDARIRQHEADQRQLATELKRATECPPPDLGSLRAQKRTKFDTDQVGLRRQRLEDCFRGFSEQIRILSAREETPYIVSSIVRLCDPDHNSVFVDPSCTECGGTLVLIPDLSMLRCGRCQLVTHQYDSAPAAAEFRADDPGDRRPADEPTDNDALYREHVEQFAEGAAATPPEVMNLLVKNLDNVAIRCRTKVLPTLIVNILRENDLASYIKYAGRIEHELTGSRAPSYDRALIERMVARYKVILSVYKTLRTQLGKTKMINFTALDRLFLRLESREDQLALLDGHKTIDVIRKENEIIELCREEAAKISHFKW